MADPTPVAFALFAFALAVYGVRFVNERAGGVEDADVEDVGAGARIGAVLDVQPQVFFAK